MDSTRSAFGMALDLELERCGWKDRERHFDDACQAALRNDQPAFSRAINAFWKSSREAGVANNAPASNQ